MHWAPWWRHDVMMAAPRWAGEGVWDTGLAAINIKAVPSAYTWPSSCAMHATACRPAGREDTKVPSTDNP